MVAAACARLTPSRLRPTSIVVWTPGSMCTIGAGVHYASGLRTSNRFRTATMLVFMAEAGLREVLDRPGRVAIRVALPAPWSPRLRSA